MKREIFFCLLLLLGAVLLRGALLEYSDLMDPTETRYASVAQEMVLLEDWLTPRLPMPEGVVPYMGKPPMHFWLTASSYSLFGVDEWTARLPSWLASICILLVIWQFGKKFFGERVAVTAALIAFSSGLFFFLSGASVTDVSLTALVSCSTYLLYEFAVSGGQSRRSAWLSAAFMAGAFLTKGPVAIVLVWLPLLLWSAVRRNFSWLKSVPWLSTGLVFLAVTTPWFIANEISNPGSLKYFFWNENIARYLFREYGDKYGSGHHHAYGMSWLMLLAAFSPWTIVLGWELYRHGWRAMLVKMQTDQHLLFALLWGISAAFFFTFVRQLHAMYILPCIPGIALFTAALLDARETERPSVLFTFVRSRAYSIFIMLGVVGVIVAGALLEFSAEALILGLLLGSAGCFILPFANENDTKIAAIRSLALSTFVIYFVVLICLTPYIDERRSAAELLDEVADSTLDEISVPQVGIMARNNYSLYWTSKAWKNELSREVKVQFVEPTHIPREVQYIVLRTEDVNKLQKQPGSDFVFAKQRGPWQLFSRKAVIS